MQLTTPRLVLRPYRKEDTDAFLPLLCQDQAHLADYFFNLLKTAASREHLAQYFAQKQQDWAADKGYACGIFLAATQQPIGHVSVRDIDWRVPKGELAYFLFSPFTGQGLAAEALAAFRTWCCAEKHFQRLFLKIAPDNAASLKTAERCGFLPEGLLRRDYRKKEQTLVDMLLYAYLPA